MVRAIPHELLEECVRAHFDPLTVRIHDSTRETGYDILESEEVDGRDRSTWQQLELHIFQELLSRDGRYEGNASSWARALSELKQMALGLNRQSILPSDCARLDLRFPRADAPQGIPPRLLGASAPGRATSAAHLSSNYQQR